MSGLYLGWGKFLLDKIVAVLVIVGVLFWLVPIVGLAIRLDSPGPILFVQMRSGRNGRQFPCIKFRTMKYIPKAEFRQVTGMDKRITTLGLFLRRTNLDEMPQFLNVLAGHMSLVGPRPHPLTLDKEYWYSLVGYPDRYRVRPGITGLAQARGARGPTNEWYQMKQRLRYDHWYIDQRNLGLDLKICWWTVASLFKGNKNAI